MTAADTRGPDRSERTPPPGADQLEAAREHVHEVVGRSGTSFFWGMRVLPRPRREAMYAIYAFCREVDDVADGPLPAAAKQAQLAEWRDEIEALFTGRPSLPTTRALAGPVARYDLPKAEFHAMIDGMEMDAEERMRAPAWVELERYCRCVAGAVGMLSVRVFGPRSREADAGALALGEALQLTNILRDLSEDAARGRLYLPCELLDEHGIAAREARAVLADPALPAVCDALARRAETRFAEAQRWLAACDRSKMRPALIMMAIYRRTLARLVTRGWHDLERSVRLGRAERLWLALRHGLV
jgi:squalene synthase HpnD